MYQSPRASSASQPWQSGTLGHFFSAALTISSTMRSRLPQACSLSQPSTAAGMVSTWPGGSAGRKADMAAMRRLPQRDVVADLGCRGQAGRRHERVVARVEHQRRDADRVQVRLGRGARPVVVGVAKPCSGAVNTLSNSYRSRAASSRCAVEQARVLGQLGQRARLHGAQEHARVDLPVEAAADARGRRPPGRSANTPRPPRRHCCAALSPASSAQRSSALPPSETPAASSGAALRSRSRARIQPISSKSPEW